MFVRVCCFANANGSAAASIISFVWMDDTGGVVGFDKNYGLLFCAVTDSRLWNFAATFWITATPSFMNFKNGISS
jgi:hypothetical protein